MDLITLEVEMLSAHLGIEGKHSRKMLLRGCLPFFDLEIQTFPKIRIWSCRIDYVLIVIGSSYNYCIKWDIIIRTIIFALLIHMN